MKLILRTVLIIVGLAVGCAPMPARIPAIAPEGINASFGKTWDVVIDMLSDANIQVKTLDKASGLIIAEAADVGSSEEDALADCGGFMRMRLTALGPMIAQYNIVVRGDSTTSTVKVRAEFTKTGKSNWICPSKNTFETRLQARVKAKAEAR